MIMQIIIIVLIMVTFYIIFRIVFKLYRNTSLFNKNIKYHIIKSNKINSVNQKFYNKVIWGEKDNPLIEITPYMGNIDCDYEDIIQNESIATSFSALLQQVPSILQNANEMAISKYTIRFSEEATKKLIDGSYHFGGTKLGQIQPVLRDSQQRFREIAHLEKTSNINPATVAFAVWQVMAIITAQKYLADINKKLAAIKSGIEEIIELLENEQKGKIYGSLQYLSQIVDNIKNKSITQLDYITYGNQIEQIERECLQISAAYELKQDHLMKEFKIKKTKYFPNNKSIKDPIKQISDYTQNNKLLLNILLTRAVATKVKCSLLVDEWKPELRIEQLKQKLNNYKKTHKTFTGTAKENLKNIKGINEEKYQTVLENTLNKTVGEIDDIHKSLSDLICKVDVQINETGHPLMIEVEVQSDGKISSMKKIINSKN